MHNTDPTILTIMLLSPGNTFMFKGEHCTVTKVSNSGFHYVKQSGKRGFMNWWYYKTTQSYKAKTGIMVGLQRKIELKAKLIRAIDSVL